MSNADSNEEWPPKPKRRQTRFLKRHIVKSDDHGFIGRLYDLGIVSLSFDTYEELARYPDCKYTVDTVNEAESLSYRVESLNLVGDMLWPTPIPESFKEMPVSRYQWLTVVTDVFLVRYVSVVDCSLLLANQVLQRGLSNQACRIQAVAKLGLPDVLTDLLQTMYKEQEQVRLERNARIHHGFERPFTDDDRTFKIASLFNDKLNGMSGSDMYGRKIDVNLSFREGLVRLQREFNRSVIQLEKHLDELYDSLWPEFEARFGPLVASAKFRRSNGNDS